MIELNTKDSMDHIKTLEVLIDLIKNTRYCEGVQYISYLITIKDYLTKVFRILSFIGHFGTDVTPHLIDIISIRNLLSGLLIEYPQKYNEFIAMPSSDG